LPGTAALAEWLRSGPQGVALSFGYAVVPIKQFRQHAKSEVRLVLAWDSW